MEKLLYVIDRNSFQYDSVVLGTSFTWTDTRSVVIHAMKYIHVANFSAKSPLRSIRAEICLCHSYYAPGPSTSSLPGPPGMTSLVWLLPGPSLLLLFELEPGPAVLLL